MGPLLLVMVARFCCAGATETGAFFCAMIFDVLVSKFLAPGGAGWPGVLKLLLGAAAAATVVCTIFMEQVELPPTYPPPPPPPLAP